MNTDVKMNNPFDLSGKTALVTGAGGGIGMAVAETLARAGAHVAALDIIAERAEPCAQRIQESGGRAFALGVDVTQPEQVETVFAEAMDTLSRLDIAVNAAGICANTPAEDMPADEWRRVIDINLNGVFWCCQSAGRRMLDNGAGSIINISSMNSIVANKPQSQAHYNASKAGVIMMTQSLAVEWAKRGIRVNAVSPGYTRTEMTERGMQNSEWYSTWLEMTPNGRVGEPAEIANAVWYLASDAASFTTGSNLVADGGYTAW